MQLSGWGQYPRVNSTLYFPHYQQALIELLEKHAQTTLIARGLGRSYGDSALAEEVISTTRLDYLRHFDEKTGVLRCDAGVSLATIIQLFVKRGWFLAVTPGTKHVSVGGAIASNVHGKNHHQVGSFKDHLLSFKLASISEGVLECNRAANAELFHATCGGMGLTGIILEATIQLKPIRSAYINQTTIKTFHLSETLAVLDAYNQATYSVAWIDCLASQHRLGRGLVMLGEHAEDGAFDLINKTPLTVPCSMPAWLLNQYSIQAFNALYYQRQRKKISHARVHLETFFYPLDNLNAWYKLYGRNGFIQYQFVIPKEAGLAGMQTILSKIASTKRGSFLAVLKAFGHADDAFLSFPMAGYTLALDFKIESGVFELLAELDELVLAHGGRLYLAKDARMSQTTFKQSYPQWEDFMALRQRLGADRRFHSYQSRRLGL